MLLGFSCNLKSDIGDRYDMMNCLVEAAVQEAYKECGCYPGYLVLSNNTCFGDSFRCFRRVFNDLGIKVSDILLNIF